MEAANDSAILSGSSDAKRATTPEAIGIAEDSGFSSIAGSIAEVSTQDDIYGKPIAQDIKFRDVDVNELLVQKKGVKRKKAMVDRSVIEERQKSEEQYKQAQREQTYKRLMHLLTKSKFYSNYIVDKITAPSKPKKGKPSAQRSANDNDKENDEYLPNKNHKGNQKKSINRSVSKDMKKKLLEQNKKMNLSQEDIEAELGNQSDPEENPKPAADDFVKPKYFDGELRDYQNVGLQWLKLLYENGVNGILGDEMGLGKTIQVIALFAHLLEKRQDGPYLILAPLSTIPNWVMEFERFAPKLPVVLYHGKPQDRVVAAKKMTRKHDVADGYKTYPIMLTNYETAIIEKSFLPNFRWRYIVIDEGHRIKDHKCQLLQVLKSCESLNRLLLTGTPLQNNLAELWSLLNFLLPEIFDDLAVFESWFDARELQEDAGTAKVLKQEEEKQVLSTLREILKPFMLRRVKSDVCLDIPPKKELVVYAPLTELQHNLYRAVLNRDLATLSRIEEQPIVIDEGPTRPKRRCVLRSSVDGFYTDRMNGEPIDEFAHYSRTNENSDLDNSNWDRNARTSYTPVNRATEDKRISEWKQYTDVNDRNRDFIIRLQFVNRVPLYRQIVNHPFLVHCPLDTSGLPEISEEMVKSSGKLLVLDAMLKKLKAQGHKVLLFSTSVMLLNLLADYLALRPWQFCTLNGSHNVDIRQESIKSFNENPEVFLFLISTRAGGVGLNLASADTVIIYDSDWNPQADIQAMARCHRIGQTRPVVIYRLCTKGTVDERIIARAEAKRKLEKMVISKQTSFDMRDPKNLLALKKLLDSNDTVIVRAEKEVYTEAELDKILDRSDLVWEKAGKSAGRSDTSLESDSPRDE